MTKRLPQTLAWLGNVNARQDTGHEECPPRQVLLDLTLGKLPMDEIEQVGRHVEGCGTCQNVMESLDAIEDSVVADIKGQAAILPPGAELEDRIRAAEQISHSVWGAPPATDELSPGPLGQYEVLERIGRGGMGTVYKARHPRLKRLVAIKVLPGDRLRDPQAVARFQREMEAVGQLDHPHVVRAHDAGEAKGRHFLVMEYVEGLNLSEVQGRAGQLRIADACEMARQAAEGLRAIDEHSLVHRDIKPSNLILDANGKIKILDLGLALLSAQPSDDDQRRVMGTPDYMAPEQAQGGGELNGRADMYSLGCTLFKLLVGCAPFSGPKYPTSTARMLAHIHDPPPALPSLRPDVPAKLAAVVERLLAKDPALRLPCPKHLIETLAPFAAGSDLAGLYARVVPLKHLAAESDTSRAVVQSQLTRLPAPRPAVGIGPSVASAGDAAFDPYHTWLGIPPEEQPPHHYRLLGLKPFEDKREVIESAGARQSAYLRTMHLGKRLALTQRLLNEVSAAKVCLLLPEKKAAYDAQLRAKLRPAAPAAATSQPAPTAGPDMKTNDVPATLGGRLGDAGTSMPAAPNDLTVNTAPAGQGTTPRLGLLIGAAVGGILLLMAAMIVIRINKDGQQTTLRVPAESDVTVNTDGSVKVATGLPVQSDHQPIQRPGRMSQQPASPARSAAAVMGLPVRSDRQPAHQPAPTPAKPTRPVQASAGLLQVLEAHYVNWLAFSPDGLLLATAGNDRRVQVRDAKTGAILHELHGHHQQVRQVAFSPDGVTLVTTGFDRTIRFWDTASGAMRRSIDAHSDRVQSIAYSPDGRFIATGGNDRLVLVHDAATGRLLKTLSDYMGSVRSVVFSPDGRTLATGGTDSMVKLWDTGTWQCRQAFSPSLGSLLCIAFHPDGRRLVIGSGKGGVRVWDLASGKAAVTCLGHAKQVYCVAFSPDGSVLASASGDRTVKLWDAAGGRLLRTLDEHRDEVCAVAFSPDGQILVSGGKDNTIRCWRVAEILGASRPLGSNREVLSASAVSSISLGRRRQGNHEQPY